MTSHLALPRQTTYGLLLLYACVHPQVEIVAEYAVHRRAHNWLTLSMARTSPSFPRSSSLTHTHQNTESPLRCESECELSADCGRRQNKMRHATKSPTNPNPRVPLSQLLPLPRRPPLRDRESMCWAEFASSAQLGVVMVVAVTSGVSLICTILLWRSQKVARDTAACFDRIENVGFKRSACHTTVLRTHADIDRYEG